MKRIASLFAMVSVFLVVTASVAFAEPDPITPEGVLGDAAETVFDSVLTVAGSILPYAATLMAFVIGWRLIRKFLRA